MRTDRLVSILLLLQMHGRITARELAQRLEVSERTVHRDMEALGAAGVPVIGERGTGGGWSLPERYRTDLTGLNEPEVQALFLTQPTRVLDDLGLQQASEGALIKLLAGLPALARRDAEHSRQRIHIDVAGWRHSEENIAWLPVLQDAVWQERKLHLMYVRGDGVAVERLVDPLGLVAKGRVWYLVAAVDDKARTYRVSRVQDVRLTDQPSTRPPDFDLAAYWDQSVVDLQSNIPQHLATLRVDQEALTRVRTWRYARIEHESEPDAEGWTTLVMQFEGTGEVAAEYVLSAGPLVKVVEPPELRERVLELARGVVELYE